MKQSIKQAGEEIKSDKIKKLVADKKKLQELVENQRERIGELEEDCELLYDTFINEVEKEKEQREKLHETYLKRNTILSKDIKKREKAKKAAKEYLKKRTCFLKRLNKQFKSSFDDLFIRYEELHKRLINSMNERVKLMRHNTIYFSVCVFLVLTLGIIALIQFLI